jgi:hypothetical protein
LLLGVSRPGGAALRPVGVLPLVMGVLERVVGVVALEARPFVCGRLFVDGEFERDDELDVSFGVLNFFTERGSFEADDGWCCEEETSRDTGLRFMR